MLVIDHIVTSTKFYRHEQNVNHFQVLIHWNNTWVTYEVYNNNLVVFGFMYGYKTTGEMRRFVKNYHTCLTLKEYLSLVIKCICFNEKKNLSPRSSK